MSLEVLADFRVEDGKQPLELVHFDLEDFELIDEYFLEAYLHEILEDAVGALFVHSLDVDVSG